MSSFAVSRAVRLSSSRLPTALAGRHHATAALLSSRPTVFSPSLSSPVRFVSTDHDEGEEYTGPKQIVPVTFVSSSGDRWSISAVVGDTLLQTAEKHDIPMFASCGGGGWPRHLFGEGPMCRSCHVYLDNGHVGKALPIEEDEEKILLNIDDRTHNSRIACEVIVTPELSGSTVVIPDIAPLRETEI